MNLSEAAMTAIHQQALDEKKWREEAPTRSELVRVVGGCGVCPQCGKKLEQEKVNASWLLTGPVWYKPCCGVKYTYMYATIHNAEMIVWSAVEEIDP